MSHSTIQDRYPCPKASDLCQQWVGKRISDLPTPAAILDRSVVQKNCDDMLHAANALGFGFRAHVKTHKTIEVTELQLPADRPLRLITSTVAEIEHLVPLIIAAAKHGRTVDVLYGVPFNRTTLAQVLSLNRSLIETGVFGNSVTCGPIRVLLDTDHHVELLAKMSSTDDAIIGIYIKIDTGYHRAGISWRGDMFVKVLKAISKNSNSMQLQGLYSHLGHSYGFSSPEQCLTGLMHEASDLLDAAHAAKAVLDVPLSLSIGATPTAASAENLLQPGWTEARETLEAIRHRAESLHSSLELHAGVYPFLDLQQLATRARASETAPEARQEPSDFFSLALRILVEVSSVYHERNPTEYLIAAGSLALGRDPCKSYEGWGIVSPWRHAQQNPNPNLEAEHYDPFDADSQGWIVGRISQEHGILTYHKTARIDKDTTPADQPQPSQATENRADDFAIGDKLLVWPNHACIAGACYGYYYVVDSSSGSPDVITDVWVRWRGW